MWRELYQAEGLGGLEDAPLVGRPRAIDHAEIVTGTLMPPKKLAVTHWSSWLLAKELKVSPATIAWAWRAYGIQH